MLNEYDYDAIGESGRKVAQNTTDSFLDWNSPYQLVIPSIMTDTEKKQLLFNTYKRLILRFTPNRVVFCIYLRNAPTVIPFYTTS